MVPLKGLFIALGIFHFLFNSCGFLQNSLPAKIVMQKFSEHNRYSRRKSSAPPPHAEAVMVASSPQTQSCPFPEVRAHGYWQIVTCWLLPFGHWGFVKICNHLIKVQKEINICPQGRIPFLKKKFSSLGQGRMGRRSAMLCKESHLFIHSLNKHLLSRYKG